MRCLSKHPEQRPASMDEVILGLKQASGGPVLVSGQFPLSGEVRLGSQTSRFGTPSQPFVAGTHPLARATPSGGFTASGMTPGHPSTLHVPQGTPIGISVPSQFPQPTPASSNWLPKVAVLGALAIAAGFLALKFVERDGRAEAASAPKMGVSAPAVLAAEPTVEPAPEPQAGPAEAPAPQPARVLVRLTSTPSGAMVTVGDKEYGPTPADIEWWGEDAEEGREVTFVFHMSGHEDASQTRVIRGGELAVDAMLPREAAPERRIVPRRRPVAEPAAPKNTPVVIDNNFKDDPY
jgi:hypothetical protein